MRRFQAEIKPGHESGDGDDGRPSKRAKTALVVWVKWGGKNAMPYRCEEDCLVGLLLRDVQDHEDRARTGVALSELNFFACESDSKDPAKAWSACGDMRMFVFLFCGFFVLGSLQHFCHRV